ncbi:MAG: glycosyltransferase [Comamonadaceae bacterium]|nr:MAG: glycosyltransferase [Comamonadaceae bacterium]
MLIHFIHPGRSYLPELAAYEAFLQARGHAALIHTEPHSVPEQATVMWWMCGAVPSDVTARHPQAWQVHEYASASVPPLAWVKDRAKAWYQPRPQYRIFQNEWIKERMGFKDAVPYEYRDMGISPGFPNACGVPRAPTYDFVYLGDMHRLIRFRSLLQGLEQAGRSILLVGDMPADLRNWLDGRPFATMAGRVPHSEVAALLTSARYGLNLVPDEAPYNQQTSTKLLEYCAAKLPVVSTDYPWVRKFERTFDAHFVYVPGTGSAAEYARLLGADLELRVHPPVSMALRTWPSILESLNIWRHLGIEP